jgi:hypothetical protein
VGRFSVRLSSEKGSAGFERLKAESAKQKASPVRVERSEIKDQRLKIKD